MSRPVDTRRLALTRWRAWQVGLAAAVVVGLPLLVAAVVLHGRGYHPVLDLAMTEFRVRDVGSMHTPLIGLPGRIGKFPEQGSHPGPLSFYLIAPVYRLLGSSAWAMLVGAIVVNIAALGTTVAMAFRRGRWWLAGAAAVWLLVAMRGYGIGVLTQPWNPYLPLVAWTVVVLAAWLVLEGDHLMLVPLVVAGSLCAQTHIPYLVLCVGLFGLCAAVSLWRWRTGDRGALRSLKWAVGVGVVLWLPPLVDQVVHSPGNIRMLQRHFMNPVEEPIGIRQGIAVLLRHLDVTQVLFGDGGAGGFVDAAYRPDRSVVPGVVLMVLWIAAALVSLSLRHRALRWLHAALAAVLALEAVSTVRIFGKVWYYLTLWAWSVTVLMAIATAATFVVALRRRLGDPSRSPLLRVAGGAGASLAAYSMVSLMIGAVSAQPPEPRLSTPLGAVVGPTVDAVLDGVGAADGADGRYVVTWSDANFFGSQGYGLVNDLERAGLRVGVDDTFRVPVTPQRVIDRRSATAEIHLSTGSYIDEWRSRPDAVEVAYVDARTPDEVAEYDRLRSEAIDGLHAAGLDDVVDLVDTNLFGASLDSRLPRAVQTAMARMLIIGQPAAVFIAPLP
jgi:hypothetical protein